MFPDHLLHLRRHFPWQQKPGKQISPAVKFHRNGATNTTYATPRHAGVQTGIASTGLAPPWCATPDADHTHGHDRPPQLYHYATDQLAVTNYTKPPGPPGERNLNRVSQREHASRHASPVARASSSHLTPTENQPRRGCLQDKCL